MKKAQALITSIAFSKFFLFLMAILFCLPAATSFAKKTVPVLDEGEVLHLTFMREEEKLARDVYLTLGEIYPGVNSFMAIDDSEQRHFDTMGKMLDKYGIDDPSTDTSVGAFTGEDFGWYFSEKFDALVDRGKTSLLEALYVGAFIEELDMNDIVHCPDVIVETENGVGEDECGLNYTDESPLVTSYNNLLEGSKDHLRAYVKAIEAQIGAGNYVAQVLTQEEVDLILNR